MSGFERMLGNLVERGLIDAHGRTTPAGEAYTDRLIAELRQQNAPAVGNGRNVKWITHRSGRP